jgi:putative nucleotidyltransferase-like protein
LNQALAQCIVKCLRFDASSDLALDRLAHFTERDWRHALEWLDNGGVALHLLQRLKDAKAEDCLPEQVRSRLERSLAANRVRTAAMADEFGALVRRFEEAGVQYAAMKGFSLIPEYCPDATLRHQMDHDFLIEPASADRAQGILRSEGYSLQTTSVSAGAALELRFTRGPVRWPGPDHDPYSFADPRPVELHFKLWDLGANQPGASGPEGALNRRQTHKFNGIRFYTLDGCDTLAFQGLHVVRHMFAHWCRLSCLLEIARFLNAHAQDNGFWDRYRDHLRDHPQLARVTNFVFSLATYLFAGDHLTGLWTSAPPDVASSVWIERYGKTWALANCPGHKLSLLLLDEFWRSQNPASTFVRRRLVPVLLPPALSYVSDKTSLNESMFLFSRTMFHGRELLRYWFQYPFWRICVRRRLAKGAPDVSRQTRGATKL